VIQTKHGIKRGVMLKQTGYPAKDLDVILSTLREQGDAYEDGGGWWPA
jgi:hypothetical protein